MEPVREANKVRTLQELSFLLKKLPRLDEELDAFVADLEGIRKNQPPIPGEEGMWIF